VVAEGIEDERTLDRLIDLEADVGQGFYIARPMQPDRFADWRADHDRTRLRVVG
jgi:EAL domain-containing protein (putative c-di-GMP-specific phosphodiesterase class I)